jgi:RNA polymerase sigma-70 factor (ECF subfamily)
MASGQQADTDDGRLVAALRAGDEAAFAELVDGYGPTLLRLALSHVPSRAVAEEVVQETWLAVLRGIDHFEGRSSLRTWITSILLNIARRRGERERRTLPISLLRRRRPEGRLEPAVDPDRFQGRRDERPGWWAVPPDRWEEPDERLSRRDAQAVLLDAIARLPERQREVMALRDLSGWSAEEACNALDLNETNQRVLLHRARAKVRAALEDHFQREQLLS